MSETAEYRRYAQICAEKAEQRLRRVIDRRGSPWDSVGRNLWASMGLGLLIVIPPWLAQTPDNQIATVNAMTVGALVIFIGALELQFVRRWEEWCELALGRFALARQGFIVHFDHPPRSVPRLLPPPLTSCRRASDPHRAPKRPLAAAKQQVRQLNG
jgi:SPW repeat